MSHLLIHEASFSAALALAGAILLLIAGTQILNWYWLAILFTGSLAVGAFRARTRILTPYEIAQAMDRRLGLHDALSTAYYFAQHPERARSPREMIEHQRSTAEDLARQADVHAGIPFHAPRTIYVNAVLVLAVGAMFGLRYGITRSLDLRPSLVRIAFDGFLGSREIADVKRIPNRRPFDEDGHRDQGIAVDPWQSKGGDLDPAADSALQTIDTPEVNNPDGGADAKAKATGQEPQPPGNDPLDGGDKGKDSQPGRDAIGDPSATPEGGSQAGQQQSAPKNSNQSASSGENSSLTDKMRDALANLMAKLRLQPRSGNNKQSGASSQSNSQSAQRQSQNQDPNASQSSQQQADSSSESQSQAQQQSQNGAQQASQGKSNTRSSDRPNSPDGRSGIGSQDGDKTAREAEQLAAMGKISEIIGKRSANVTGEVMVEVASGKQQLKTQYSQRKAQHGEAGSEINRDEIPLAYQQYVQQYFEEIRKLPSRGKSDSKTRSPGN